MSIVCCYILSILKGPWEGLLGGILFVSAGVAPITTPKVQWLLSKRLNSA